MSKQIFRGANDKALEFLMVSSVTHIDGVEGATPTVEIRKEGGLYAAPAGTIFEIGNGLYQVNPNPANYDTLGSLWLHAEAAGCDPVDKEYQIVPDPRGPGAVEATIEILDGSSVPIPGVQVWLTTDPTNSQSGVVANPLTTDAFGRVVFLVDPSLEPSINVTDASNASPIVITTATDHGLSTGDRVVVENVAGNGGANGTWSITVLDDTSFELDGSTGSGAYTGLGTIRKWAAYYRWCQKSGVTFHNPQPIVVP